MKSKRISALRRFWIKGNAKEKSAAVFIMAIFLTIGLAIPSQVKLPPLFQHSLANSPRFFPYIISTTGGIISLIIFIRSFSRTPGEAEGGEGILGMIQARRVAPVIVIAIIYLASFDFLGYVLSGTLCFAGFLWYYGVSLRREYAVAIPLIILFPLLTYLLFKYELYVPLPEGILQGIFRVILPR